MIPISDDNPTRTTPFVNWALIALNLVVWLWQVGLIASGNELAISSYGMVPAQLSTDPGGEAFTIVSSMFMHGSWGHIIGNMLFLRIFGDNVEDAMGHARYVIFYLLAGVAAALAQFFIDPASGVPMVGASGAIAGVLGAYVVLYPRAPITVLLPPFFFLVFPAWLVVGGWFAINLFTGLQSLGPLRSAGAGVAFFAHVGGFIAGFVAVRLFTLGRERRTVDRWHGWRPPQRARSHARRREPRRWDPWG